jgi:hypothetical protein
MGKIHPEMLLNTEEDFGIILEALDGFAQHSSNLALAIEATTVAVREATKLDAGEVVSDEAFAKSVEKGIDKGKINDRKMKIKEKIILLKAKVVMTKEFLLGTNLSNEIDSLLT